MNVLVALSVAAIVASSGLPQPNTKPLTTVQLTHEELHVQIQAQFEEQFEEQHQQQLEMQVLGEQREPECKNRWGIQALTPEERDLIAQVTYLEAGNQPTEGKLLTIVVIFNHYLEPTLPDTIYGVLSAPNHFTVWKNRHLAKPGQDIYDLIDACIDGTADPEYTNKTYLRFDKGGKGEKVGDQYFH